MELIEKILRLNKIRQMKGYSTIHRLSVQMYVLTSKLAFSGALSPCIFLLYVATRQSDESIVVTLFRSVPAIVHATI